MTELSCKNCNAPLNMAEAKNGVIACSFCGSVFTLPKKDASDKVRKHLDAGETALDQCRFDDALASYTKAIEADGREPEGYWGRALARNRVQYLRDTVNNRLQPICHEVSEESFTSDPDYKRALTLATPEQRAEYAKKGEEIDYIRSEFYALERTGLKYDCFICVKVTEEDGGHTEDSFAALKLYNALKKAGYRPFFSEEEMGERTGADYEALILYALKSAGSLLIVCSDKRYLETKWVKNEYTRYAAMLTDEEKERGSMAIVYLGKPIEKLPGIKGKLQGVDYRQFDAMNRICAFIDSHDAEKQRKKAEREAAEREARERKEAEEREKIRAAAEAERKAAEEAAKARAEAAEKRAAEMERRLRELEAAQNAPKNESKSAPKPAPTKPAAPAKPATGGDFGDIEIPDRAAPAAPAKAAAKPAPKPAKPASAPKPPAPAKPAPTSAPKPAAAAKSAPQAAAGKPIFKIENGTLLRYNGPGGDVVIPAGVKQIGVMGNFAREVGAFRNRRDITSVTIPAGVTKIGHSAFSGCKALAAVTIPAGVTEIGTDAFKGCKGLKRIALPAGLQTISVAAFEDCTALEAVDIPDSVTELRRAAFMGCKNLTRVTLPAGLEKIESNLFSGCERLQSIVLPAGVKEIEGSAFWNCKSLSGIVWPQALQTIGSWAFAQCGSLPAVILPDGVTEIGERAFSGCKALKTVSVPGSVKKIGETAFGNGDTTITVRGKKPLIKPRGWHRHWKGEFAVVKYTE